jgi:hypothetical protein
MIINVPRRDNGIAMQGIIVALIFLKNKNTIKITNIIEINKVFSTSNNDALIVRVLSNETVKSISL